MAPVLQCPDCSTKHPLDVAHDGASFRCSGCGRVLKVPAQFRAVPTPAGAGGSPHPNGSVPRPSLRRQRAMAGAVPVLWRLIAWVIALPLSFGIVFLFARAIGVLSTNQLEDVFFEAGWDRFWPVARLLPFVALLTASVVHFSVLGLSHWRALHAARRAEAARQPRPEPREPLRPVS